MVRVEIVKAKSWNDCWAEEEQTRAITALEQGKVLYFPDLSFSLQENEMRFLTPDILKVGSKNISYDFRLQQIKGAACSPDKADALQALIARFYQNTTQLVKNVLKDYQGHTQFARTSFRPAEIKGRVTSYKKDDTRLHVDAFPATPNQGTRILRIFSNINREGKPRTWRLGEPFENVAQQFLPHIAKPFPASRWLMHRLGLTKTYRTLYDHYMLQIHDKMKADQEYQQKADQETRDFVAGSTWMVMTDQVSHAAMSGQHLLEQTIHLPVQAMRESNLSPLHILERLIGHSLLQ